MFEVVKDCVGRETCFGKLLESRVPDYRMVFVRGIKAHNVKYLRYYFDKFDFFKQPTNLYCSIALVNGMPLFTFNLKERSEQMTDFNDAFKDYVTDYDFFIDLDPEEGHYTELLKRDALDLMEVLDDYSVHYSIRFTGKGFHFFIKGSDFDWVAVHDKPGVYADLSHRVKHVLGIKSCDNTLFSDSDVCRRIYKVPYTLDCKSWNVCLPLTKEMLMKFEISMVKVENVLQDQKLFKRGHLYQNMDRTSRLKMLIEELKK